jgi:acetoin utilization deacetylase AcuC-like enzyme
MKIITDIRCAEFSAPGHPERPGRILAALDTLKSQDALRLAWGEPLPVEDASLLRAHSPEHLQRLDIPFDLDADTPAHPQIPPTPAAPSAAPSAPCNPPAPAKCPSA